MKKLVITMVLFVAAAASMSASALTPMCLRCEYACNPSGVDMPHPRLFWMDQSRKRDQNQSAYEILAASSLKKLNANQGDLWDSGKVISDETIQVPYEGQTLQSAETVYWKVRAWDNAGKASDWSKPAAWTMGLLHASDWRAHWVRGATNCETLLLRRRFVVKPGLRRALIFVCGLGQYEMSLNGKTVGNDFLSPGWTDYRKTCLYNTRDITSFLRGGSNAIGLFLGNGMYRVERIPGRYTKFKGSFGPLKAIAMIELDYANGLVTFIGTDDQWRAAPGPVTFCSIYGGEDFDGGLAMPGWNEPKFDDSHWRRAQEVNGPGGRLRGLSCSAPPIREYQIQRPVSRHKLANGDEVYDLGQNAAHVLKITVSGPVGSRVRLFPSELTNADGSINQSSMGAGHRGRVWCEYIKGTDRRETWAPKFFYVGCRYVQAHLIPAHPGGLAPALDSIEGIVVHSASPSAGQFTCSDTLFNRIDGLVRWAQMNNMMSLLTDCPHRERLGWLEQDHLNGASLRYDFDLARLFTKEMNDIADAQQPNGLTPAIAPEYTVFHGAFRDAPAWGSACVIVPWQQYEFDGDLELLREHYEGMKRYVAYLRSTATNDIVSHGLGDWYDLGPKPPGFSQLTPIALVATAFYYYDTHLLSRVAALLGRPDEARRFSRQAAQIRAAFNGKFFDPASRDYATGSQTANAMPLVMGLVEPSNRASVLQAIVRDVGSRDYALTSGDVGYRYLLQALATHGNHVRLQLGFDGSGRYVMRLLPEDGRSDMIFAMNDQTNKPGYGYQLARGATSLTESWNARRGSSQDHFMLGQIQEWFYRDLAGIRDAPGSPGFKHIVIRPQPAGDLRWVKANYNSIRGQIASDWKISLGRFRLRVEIPANTAATVYVPATSAGAVTESGRAAAKSPGIKFLRMSHGYAVFAVASGRYHFESKF